MKIALVLLCEFYSRNGFGQLLYKNRKGAYAPTTLTTLASLVPKELNAEVEIYDEFIERFNPKTIKADLVGLSFTTPNANHAYELAAVLKSRGITVVFGGYHTSLLTEEATQHADACVVGYAEQSWPQLLRDFSENNLKKIYNQPSGDEFKHFELTHSNLLKKRKYFYPHSIEYSRNCVNRCRFCVIAAIHPSVQHFRELEHLRNDIKRTKANKLIFLDSSPAENKQRFYELCDTLKELKVEWHCNISLRALDELSLIKRMSESGCKGVLIGFESLNQKSLNSENKTFNKVEQYKVIVDEFHRNKMYVFGTFVFGFDDDDTSIFDTTISFVKESKIDVVNYSILIPFPGTPLFNDLSAQNRIVTKNWSEYDGKHVVFSPKSMSSKELIKGLQKAYRETFTLSSIIQRTLLTPSASLTNFFGNIALGVFNKKSLKNKDA